MCSSRLTPEEDCDERYACREGKERGEQSVVTNHCPILAEWDAI